VETQAHGFPVIHELMNSQTCRNHC